MIPRPSALLPIAIAAALASSAASAGAADAPVAFAERIGDATPAARIARGPDAVGGLDDWALGNGTLCAVVADPGHEGYLLATGGSLVDLGFCGRADDQWANFEQLANLSRTGTLRFGTVRAEADGASARVVVEGERDGVAVETTYEVDVARPRVLRVRTRAERRGDGARLFALGDVTVHNDGTLRPFTLARRGPSEGFAHAGIGKASIGELIDAVTPIESVTLVGPSADDASGAAIAPISYTLRVTGAKLVAADGSERELPTIGLSTETVTMLATFARPYWVGRRDAVGLIQLAQSLFMDVEAGEAVVFEREIEIEPRIDGRAATDALYAEGVLVEGRVDTPAARVHAFDADGSALAFAAPDANGRFALRLPRAPARLRVLAPGGRAAEREVDLSQGERVELGDVSPPPAAWVALPADVAPARLVFLGVGDTPDPVFGDDLTGFRIGGAPFPSFLGSNDVVLGGFGTDPARVAVRPGRYAVLATRGPEFSVATASLEAVAGETVTLAIEAPQRAVASPGWIAADLHVHAAPSDDSTVPMATRLATFVAEGGEVIVSTDHDHVSDYAPLVARFGLRDRVRSIVGLEVTGVVRTEVVPASVGHHNVFPLPLRPALHRAGALRSEDQRLRDIVAQARALPGERLVQVNHPRSLVDVDAASDGGAFLEHLSVGRAFDPQQPIDAAQNASLVERDATTGLRDVDFDAIELLNGPSMDRYRAIRADWHSLLRQGFRRTATANSDTHSRHVVAAVPRTYVRMADDDPARFDEGAFIASARGGAAFGSTGPLLDVRIGDAGPGDTATLAAGGDATLRIAVRAAEWVPVSQLRVYVDGALATARPIEGPLETDVVLPIARDAFVTVEVEGAADATYAALLPGFTPFAFTNPIFVDADGDGVWTPPGLD
ncbi:MAG: CehA/McbA family metallohydrolase [Myxococcota bacterium]